MAWNDLGGKKLLYEKSSSLIYDIAVKDQHQGANCE